MAGLIGSLDPFASTDAVAWKTYLSRVEQFYKANKIEDNRKKSVFLSVIGGETFSLLETFGGSGQDRVQDARGAPRSVGGPFHSEEISHRGMIQISHTKLDGR